MIRNRFFIQLLALFTLSLSSLLLTDIAAAQPEITAASGEIKTGSVITLEGTGFGIKPNAAPLRFEQFEADATGNLPYPGGTVPTEIPYWSGRNYLYADGTPSDPTISDVNQRHVNSSRNAAAYLERINGTTTSSQFSWKDNIGWHDTGIVYINLWIYMDLPDSPIFNDGTSSTYQIKLFTAEPEIGADGIGGNDYLDEFVYWFRGPPSYELTANNYHRLGKPAGQHVYLSEDMTAGDGGWYNVVFLAIPGTNDDTETTTDCWRKSDFSDGVGTYTVDIEDNVNCLADETLGVNPTDALRFGYYIGNNLNTGVATIYWDDIYIDNSFARVEIGNNKEYEKCTIREIQYPTSWQSDTIEFRLNSGMLVGEDLWVFAVSPDNTPSQGFQLGTSEPRPKIENMLKITQ